MVADFKIGANVRKRFSCIIDMEETCLIFFPGRALLLSCAFKKTYYLPLQIRRSQFMLKYSRVKIHRTGKGFPRKFSVFITLSKTQS